MNEQDNIHTAPSVEADEQINANTIEIEINTDNNNDAANNSNDDGNAQAAQAPAPKEIDYEAELKEQKDKYLRLYAEFDTFRRRVAREKLELSKTAGKGIVVALLPVLDDFERAFKANTTDTDLTGFQLIYQKIKHQLEQKGLKVMDAIGKDFDPDLHEAIAQVPAPSNELRGKILDEAERGYYMSDIIVRYAKVIVYN